jgi:glutamyl-tRNA synthetase
MVTPFTHDPIKLALEGLAAEIGWSRSEVNGAAIRVAVTGRTVGPPLYESLEFLGRNRALERIERARAKLAGGHD